MRKDYYSHWIIFRYSFINRCCCILDCLWKRFIKLRMLNFYMLIKGSLWSIWFSTILYLTFKSSLNFRCCSPCSPLFVIVYIVSITIIFNSSLHNVFNTNNLWNFKLNSILSYWISFSWVVSTWFIKNSLLNYWYIWYSGWSSD